MRALLVAVVGLLVTFNASADYFKGGIGYTIGGETELSGAGSSSADLDSEILFPILAAYGFEVFESLSGEVEVSFRKNDYETGSNEANVMALAFNMVGGVPMGPVSLTGGIGATFGTYDLADGLDDGTAFGVQAFGGVDFQLQDNITLGGEIRYFTTVTDVDCGSGVDGEYNNTSLLFVAKFGL